MFEINDDLVVEKEVFCDSIIYTVDNFYKYPDEVHDYLFNETPPLWKAELKPSHNAVHFEDRRLLKSDSRIYPVVNWISKLTKTIPDPDTPPNTISTNQIRFFDHEFNDIENCYWQPHIDLGYNAIIYFNKDDSVNGTNLYRPLAPERRGVPEHYYPWRSKDDLVVVKHLKPEYNRLIIFDGNLFVHGMNIADKRYFSEEYRKNQVSFFAKPSKNY